MKTCSECPTTLVDKRARTCSPACRARRSRRLRPPRAGRGGGWLYVIEAMGTDLVKIGRAGDPERRLQQLQAASPVPLQIRLMWPAGQLEPLVHRRLRDFRRHNEWFLDVPEVTNVLTEFGLGTEVQEATT